MLTMLQKHLLHAGQTFGQIIKGEKAVFSEVTPKNNAKLLFQLYRAYVGRSLLFPTRF